MGWLNSWDEFTGGIKKVGNNISSGIKKLGRNIDTHVFQQVKKHPWEALGWVLAPGLMPFAKGAQEMFKQPDPPDFNAPPAPLQMQNLDMGQIEKEEEQKKKKGASGTLLTGGGGLTEKGEIYRKSVLGG